MKAMGLLYCINTAPRAISWALVSIVKSPLKACIARTRACTNLCLSFGRQCYNNKSIHSWHLFTKDYTAVSQYFLVLI